MTYRASKNDGAILENLV